jgi:hypothetical protein
MDIGCHSAACAGAEKHGRPCRGSLDIHGGHFAVSPVSIGLICSGLVVATLAIFGQVVSHQVHQPWMTTSIFSEQPDGLIGLTLKGVAWALYHLSRRELAPSDLAFPLVDCQFADLEF